MLLNRFKHHHTKTLFIFTIVAPYVVFIVIFFFIFIMINRINTDAVVLLLIFQNMSYYFWIIPTMKNVNNFQIVKVQPQGVA